MPELNAKEASTIVRQYFDDIKKTKFIFDISSVNFDEDEEIWIIECEVANIFDETPRYYHITVDDETGDILDVSENNEE